MPIVKRSSSNQSFWKLPTKNTSSLYLFIFIFISLIFVIWAANQQTQTRSKAANSAIPLATIPRYRVFATSGLYSGNLGGQTGADLKCQSAASDAGLEGTYKAWVSTPNLEAKDKVYDGIYVLTDNTIIANSRSDLLDGLIQNKINKDEYGETVPITPDVWTSTTKDGLLAGANCNDWTTTSQSVYGISGSTNYTNTWWTRTDKVLFNCSYVQRIYCVDIQGTESIITPTPTPVPNQRRCLNTNFDLPTVMKTGSRYDGHFNIINSTTKTLWYNIVFSSNLGSFGPMSAHVMGLPGKKTVVGFALYKIEPKAFGSVTATTTVEGDTTSCDTEVHRVRVN